MKPALVDTDILSMLFRGNANVVAQFQLYLAEHRQINLSMIIGDGHFVQKLAQIVQVLDGCPKVFLWV